MTTDPPPTLEDRLRRTLQEVADRVPAEPPGDGRRRLRLPPLASLEPGRRPASARLPMAVAAVVVVVAGLAALTLARRDNAPGPDRPPATAGDPPLVTAGTSNGIGLELRLARRGGGLCVVLADDAGLEPAAPEACLRDAHFPVQATRAGTDTAVYGLYFGDEPPAAGFGWTTVRPAPGDLLEAGFEGGRAFLLLIEDDRATGTVTARGPDGAVLATGAFDEGGPARPPARGLGPVALDHAFTRDGAIWARGVDGTEVRLTSGTARSPNGWPSASPDGHTVLFSEIDEDAGVFWSPMAVGVADAAARERRSFATGWSPSGARLAGMVPLDDTGAPTEVSVVDAERDEELLVIPLGVNDEVGDVRALAWDGDGTLLAQTVPTNDVEVRRHLWLLDLDARTATPLVLDAETAAATLVMAERSRHPGEVPALRLRDGRAEWGDLLVLGDGTALFKRRAWLEEFSPGSGPDVARRVYLDARRAGGWLLGDGERLYALDDDGRLTLLRDDVERASAP